MMCPFRHSTSIGQTGRQICHTNIALCMHCMLRHDNKIIQYSCLQLSFPRPTTSIHHTKNSTWPNSKCTASLSAIHIILYLFVHFAVFKVVLEPTFISSSAELPNSYIVIYNTCYLPYLFVICLSILLPEQYLKHRCISLVKR